MENQPTILYEDNHVIVAVKPQNLLTQGDDTGDDNLLDQVKQYVKETCGKPGEAYIGLVHRMDRPVGGLLVFARTSKAASRLSEQVRVHELNRQYVAIVEGETPDQFTYVDYLAKDPEKNIVTVLPSYLKLQGKEAILHGRTVARRDGLSLVAIQLETGRAHQIRVQMQHAGHPLWGDHRYGSGKGGSRSPCGACDCPLPTPSPGSRCFSSPRRRRKSPGCSLKGNCGAWKPCGPRSVP